MGICKFIFHSTPVRALGGVHPQKKGRRPPPTLYFPEDSLSIPGLGFRKRKRSPSWDTLWILPPHGLVTLCQVPGRAAGTRPRSPEFQVTVGPDPAVPPGAPRLAELSTNVMDSPRVISSQRQRSCRLQPVLGEGEADRKEGTFF